MKRALVLAGLVAMSGCAARSVDTFTCEHSGQRFDYSLPDDDPESLDRITVIHQRKCSDGTSREEAGIPAASNAKIVLTCDPFGGFCGGTTKNKTTEESWTVVLH